MAAPLHLEPVSTSDGSLLEAARGVLGEADEARLCVAFVGQAGVHLLRRELDRLGSRAQLLATTVFGSTSPAALGHAARMGVQVRTLNPSSSGTYHPKLYLGRRGDELQALVGSANLTGGLMSNIEVGCLLRGSMRAPQLERMWTWAGTLWDDARTRTWTASPVAPPGDEPFAPELWSSLVAEVSRDAVFRTLGPNPRPNRVTELVEHGLYVETERSRNRGAPPQLVPAWMVNLAWDTLRTHGELTNAHLLRALRVHRSSAVCALLARLPGVERVPGRGIRLRWKGLGAL